ncbi:hypothetical protein EP7_001676 [Isosphaeraceae bacterium EP7]
MQDPQDPFDAFEPEAPHARRSQAPAVLIVTARRGRMLDALLPPTLIAAAAGLVLAYRGAQTEWDGLSLPRFATVAKAAPVLVKAEPKPPEAAPNAATVPVTPPVVAAVEPKPVEPKPLVEPETKLTDAAKAKVWDEIEVEARKTREQQAELEKIKDDEDARAAALPPPIDRKAPGMRIVARDINALLQAQMQMQRRIAERQQGAQADVLRRHAQQVEALRRSWINGGGLPNRMGGRPGVPLPPRPIPPAPPHEAFADLQQDDAPRAEPQVRMEFRQFNGPGNLQGYVFRRQIIVKNEGEAPPPPRPIEAENE